MDTSYDICPRNATFVDIYRGKLKTKSASNNDYRNIVVAEAMKVLGFVNRHSRGVLKVQKDLMANENGMPEYDFSYQTSVLVREKNPFVETR